MRILNVSQSCYPFQDRGGPAFKVRAISRALARQGHEVTVLTADLGFGPHEIAMASASRIPPGWLSNQDGVETVYLRTQCRYRGLTVNFGVYRFCRDRLRDFDVVHVYGLYDLLGPVTARYCRWYDKPYLVEPLGMTRPIDRAFLPKRTWHRIFREYLHKSARIVATSELEEAELLEDGFAARQIVLRYNGLEKEEFLTLPTRGRLRQSLAIKDDEHLVLFLGRLIPRKGADLLIEALPRMSAKIRVLVAGPEGERGYAAFLREKARTLGVEKQVVFRGPVYGNEKKSAMVDADVFALPSRYENFGNAAAEAVACGTPVIVSDRCGISSLIKDRAGVVTCYSAPAIAHALQSLLGNAREYERLKAGCPVVASEIWWDNLIPPMQNLYQNVSTNAS